MDATGVPRPGHAGSIDARRGADRTVAGVLVSYRAGALLGLGGHGGRHPPTAGPGANPTPAWLDAKNSLSFKDPYQLKDRTGDIRFTCAKDAAARWRATPACSTMVFGEPGANLDECRQAHHESKNHRLPLAAAASGTEICVRRRNGDIALLVIQTKSTAMPDIAFVSADMTVWRQAG